MACADKNMGLGFLGPKKGADIRFKRKFRWTFRVDGICGGLKKIEEHYVKLASRPNLTIDETEIIIGIRKNKDLECFIFFNVYY